MKKSILTLISIVVLSCSVFAQVKLGQKLKEVQQKQAAAKRLPNAKSTFSYDSIGKAWMPELNYVLTYSQGVLTQEIATNSFGVNFTKTSYIYNGKNIVEHLVEQFDAGNWVNFYRLVFDYNSNGELIREEVQEWLDNKWYVTYGIAREYDLSKTDTITIIDSMWNGNNYDAEQKIIEIYVPGTKDYSELTFFMKDIGSNDWLATFRQFYTYDSDARLINVTKQNWLGTEWINFMNLVDYHYDTVQNRIYSYTTQNWNMASQQWVDYAKDSFEYYDYKGLVNTSYYFTPSGLIPSTRSIYLNDSLMNQIVSKYETWDVQKNQWDAMMHNETVYTYDTDSVILSKVDLSLVGDNNIDSMFKEVYFYGLASGLNDTKTFDYVLYPNPAKDNLNIKLSNVSNTEKVELVLKSISGQTMIKRNFNSNNITLDVSSLSTGLYLLQINTESGSQTTKLSIK